MSIYENIGFFKIQGTKQQKQQWNLLWLTLNEQSKIGVKLQSKMLYFKGSRKTTASGGGGLFCNFSYLLNA